MVVAIVTYNIDDYRNATFSLFDQNGKILQRNTIENKEGSFIYDLSNYPNGTYNIILLHDGTSAIKRFVKIE